MRRAGSSSRTVPLTHAFVGRSCSFLLAAAVALAGCSGAVDGPPEGSQASQFAWLVGIAILVAWGERAIVGFVLAAPVATWLVGVFFVRRLPATATARTTFADLWSQWSGLARMGFALMLSGLAGLLGQLLVRTLVQRELGADDLGQFQAAWLVSMTYIGFVLGAMATDYYPRLTAAIAEPAQVNRMVNEQAEVALLLATPPFLALVGLAPWVVRILYSDEFGAAVDILRWQVLGDVLKVASWPLSFVLLAAGAARAYLATEVLAFGTFAAFTWVGLPLLGVEATGIGFLLMYALQLPVVYLLARRLTGFRWRGGVLLQAAATFAMVAAIVLLSLRGNGAAAVAGTLLAAVTGAYAAWRLRGRLRGGVVARDGGPPA